jgi:alpha-mannosidase
VPAGADPLLASDTSLLAIEGDGVVLSALKPAEHGAGIVLRLLNLTAETQTTTVTARWPWSTVTAVRLDETPLTDAEPLSLAGTGSPVPATVPARALLTLLFA